MRTFQPAYQHQGYSTLMNQPFPQPLMPHEKPKTLLLGDELEVIDEKEGVAYDLDERFEEATNETPNKYETLQSPDEGGIGAEGGGGGGAELKPPKSRYDPSSASPAVTRAKKGEKTSSLSEKELRQQLASARRAIQKYEGASDDFQSDPKKTNTYNQNKRNLKRLNEQLEKRGLTS